jgi:hypothetical protein
MRSTLGTSQDFPIIQSTLIYQTFREARQSAANLEFEPLFPRFLLFHAANNRGKQTLPPPASLDAIF